MASRNAPLTGIAFKIAAVLIFLVMSSLLKASNGIPAGELVFFRSFFGLLPVVIFLWTQGELSQGVRTAHFGGHVWRGLVGTVSMSLGFFALTRLPLPESVTINYAMPLFIVALSALVLHERVHIYRWSAVIIGLVGVVIIAWPRFTVISSGVDSGAAIGALAALASAGVGAVAQLLVRRLTRTERSATIVFYFLAVSSVISLVTIPFGWLMPTPLQAVYLVGAGIAGGIAQILMTESYRHAELSVVAPFEYTSLVFSVIIGFLFFGDVPTWFMLVGGVIVVGSGLFIIYRERQLGLDNKRAEEVVTPQG
jgi:drug/metabolite transporter (DMT)-like permease